MLHRPVTVVADKAQSHRCVIRAINQRYDPHFGGIRHIDKTCATTALRAITL